MANIEVSRFVPEEGDVVEIPETVGRVDTFNDSAPASGERFAVAVVGRGETELTEDECTEAIRELLDSETEEPTDETREFERGHGA